MATLRIFWSSHMFERVVEITVAGTIVSITAATLMVFTVAFFWGLFAILALVMHFTWFPVVEVNSSWHGVPVIVWFVGAVGALWLVGRLYVLINGVEQRPELRQDMPPAWQPIESASLFPECLQAAETGDAVAWFASTVTLIRLGASATNAAFRM